MKKITDSIDEFLHSTTPNRFALTHNGTFHCDDVFATVILDEIMHHELTLIRVSTIPDNVLSTKLIIFDIGGGKFDHHQTDSPTRRSGIKYSSTGLIWKKYGKKLLKKRGVSIRNIDYVWNKIDHEFIQAIDASDNGMLKSSYPNFYTSSLIASFNPIWDFDEESNECFMNAFNFAKTIFDNEIEKEMAFARAIENIEKSIANSENGIMILPKYIPWDDYFNLSKNPERKKIDYVIFKNNRDENFCIKGTKYARNRLFPNEWAGLAQKDLIKLTKVKTATFCHPKRHICGAKTLEDAIKLVNIARNY